MADDDLDGVPTAPATAPERAFIANEMIAALADMMRRRGYPPEEIAMALIGHGLKVSMKTFGVTRTRTMLDNLRREASKLTIKKGARN